MHQWNTHEQDAYLRARMMELDDEDAMDTAYQKGKEEGIEMGEQKKAVEIARAMLYQGIPLEIVLQTTGLSENNL